MRPRFNDRPYLKTKMETFKGRYLLSTRGLHTPVGTHPYACARTHIYHINISHMDKITMDVQSEQSLFLIISVLLSTDALGVCLLGRTHAMELMWRSEDNFVDSVLLPPLLRFGD